MGPTQRKSHYTLPEELENLLNKEDTSMAIQVWLEASTKDKIRLPVIPTDLVIGYSWGWRAVDLANAKQYLVGGAKQLDVVSMSSFFPKDYNAGYCEFSNLTNPKTLVNQIKKWASDRKTIKLIFIGADFDYKQDMVITSFQPELKGGVANEIQWSMELTQNYRPTIKQTKVKQSIVSKPKPKPPSPNKKNTSAEWIYVVKSGDCLWNICQKYYKAPTKCWDLAKKNDIKNANLIYPGQKLKMWAR